MQIVEEVAETVAPDKNRFADKVPPLAEWLNSTAQDSAGTNTDSTRWEQQGRQGQQ